MFSFLCAIMIISFLCLVSQVLTLYLPTTLLSICIMEYWYRKYLPVLLLNLRATFPSLLFAIKSSSAFSHIPLLCFVDIGKYSLLESSTPFRTSCWLSFSIRCQSGTRWWDFAYLSVDVGLYCWNTNVHWLYKAAAPLCVPWTTTMGIYGKVHGWSSIKPMNSMRWH